MVQVVAANPGRQFSHPQWYLRAVICRVRLHGLLVDDRIPMHMGTVRLGRPVCFEREKIEREKSLKWVAYLGWIIVAAVARSGAVSKPVWIALGVLYIAVLTVYVYRTQRFERDLRQRREERPDLVQRAQDARVGRTEDN